MSLQSRLEAFAAAVGADIKALQANSGGGAPGTKVSVLPAAVSLDGTESIPLVQGGVSKKAASALFGLGAASDLWTYEKRTTDYTNSTVTASDVFTGFTPAASKTYIVEALLPGLSAATTTGIQLALTGPTTGITVASVNIDSPLTATTELPSFLTGLGAFTAPATALVTASNYKVQAILVTGTPGAGNIRVQARSEVASSQITIKTGAFMRWREI